MKVALVCCGRLENRYAVEFIEYYKQLGFDHIFIADNNRDGEEHFEDVLQSYIDNDFVTIENYRNINEWIHYDLAYIKHFSTKTIEEWVKYKCRRGVIDRNLDKFFEDYKGYFFNINKVTSEKLNYLKEHNINIDNLNL